MIKKNKVILTLLLAIVLTLIMGFSASYSFFAYTKEGVGGTLVSGEISIDFVDETNFIDLTDAYPVSDNIGKIYPYYNDFSVVGVTSMKTIKYEVIIVPEETNTLSLNYIKIYLTDQEDNPIIEPTILSQLINNDSIYGKEIYSNNIYSVYTNGVYETNTIEKDFRLRVWIDESYDSVDAETFGFKIYLNAYNID